MSPLNQNIYSDEKVDEFIYECNRKNSGAGIPKTSEKLNGTKLLIIDGKGKVMPCQWIKYAGAFAVLFFIFATAASIFLYFKHDKALQKYTAIKNDLQELKVATQRLAVETGGISIRIKSLEEAQKISRPQDIQKNSKQIIPDSETKTFQMESAEQIQRTTVENEDGPETVHKTDKPRSLPESNFETGWVDADDLALHVDKING